MKRALILSLLIAASPISYSFAQKAQSIQVDKKIKREFFFSLRNHDFEKAEELIASGKIPVDIKNKFGQTPLYYAVDANSVDFARFLIKHGAKINAKDYFGFTPLHEAVVRGSYEVAKLLIEKGAKVNERDKYGYTPLHLVCIYNRPKTAKLLIENGAKVNEKDNYGNTPLHYCGTSKGSYAATKVLLENGADPSIKNQRGKTPLDLANESKNYRVARLMAKYLKVKRNGS
ncbi:Ankyrin repeat [Balnearium lithotrophicum]|uniref:Ankyrin repeat n=1 Tax=Balnearium lithotrophicum TaxID=223788 RepID=A0A521E153_9BACT|nr:ankyrin repeat domain-containing protein [Balnearium lithotrophicum]SMO77697.1 Ankyrin repeat [Balnearium lithotrophicum]